MGVGTEGKFDVGVRGGGQPIMYTSKHDEAAWGTFCLHDYQLIQDMERMG